MTLANAKGRANKTFKVHASLSIITCGRQNILKCRKQGISTDGDGSVQLTSKLRNLVLLKKTITIPIDNAADLY